MEIVQVKFKVAWINSALDTKHFNWVEQSIGRVEKTVSFAECVSNQPNVSFIPFNFSVSSDVNCVNEEHAPDPQICQSDITVPRLMPSESSSTSAILKKIALQNPQINLTKSNNVEEENISTKFKISFDVYLPSVRLRKSIPRLPNYRVVVCSSDSKVPNSADVRATLGSLKDGVPLLFAVCSLSNTSFFCFSEVNLPTQITIG